MHYALYTVLSGRDGYATDAELPGNGGADARRVEDFTLDGAGLHHVGGESLEGGLLSEVEFYRLYATQEVFLEVADPAELGNESAVVPGEAGPVRPLVQVLGLHVCGDCGDRESLDAAVG